MACQVTGPGWLVCINTLVSSAADLPSRGTGSPLRYIYDKAQTLPGLSQLALAEQPPLEAELQEGFSSCGT